MSEFRENVKHYLSKIGQALVFAVPGPKGSSNALRSAGKGAVVAFAITLATSIVLSIVVLATGLTNNFAIAGRAGALAALGGFGAVFNFETSALGATGTIGLHSGLIALIAILVTRRIARNSKSGQANQSLSAFHYSLGFTAFIAAAAFVVAGFVGTNLYSAVATGTTALSLLITFLVIWVAAALAGSNGKATVAAWSRLALVFFARIYSTLIGLAAVVFVITSAMNPVFQMAVGEQPPTPEVAVNTTIWIITIVALFVINAAAVLFAGFAGLPIGSEITLSGQFPAITWLGDTLNSYNFWLFNNFGVWAYVGVALVVSGTAFVAGALASKKLGVSPSGSSAFWQALMVALFSTGAVAYFASVQLSASPVASEKPASVAVNFGVAVLAVVAFTSVLQVLSFWAASKHARFTHEALPRFFAFWAKAEKPATRSSAARVVGLLTVGLLLAAALTPITAATINRMWAAVDGPTQLGDSTASKLVNLKIADLKKLLSNKSTKAWLSDKILQAAQLDKNSEHSTTVLNDLDKNWRVGNLDATVTLTLGKGKESTTYTFQTDSKVTNPSWLITHPEFKALLSPVTIHLAVNPALASQSKKLNLTVNGQKSSAGSYFAIPGKYKITADGYKLIAATNQTYYTSNNEFTVNIGTSVNLPKGAADTLNAALLGKAKSCFKASSSGSADCYTTDAVISNASVSAGNAPTDAFESSQDGFVAGKVSCVTNKATDKLKSDVKMTRTESCSATVTFTEHFYKSAKQTVPVYETQTTCQGAEVAYNGSIVHWNSFWGRWEDDNYWYYSSDVSYDDCAISDTVEVKTGTKTILVRGAEYAHVTKTAPVKAKVTVVGTIDAKDKFSVTK